MSSKTKIVVLRMKELIYTGIFVALGILLILLLVYMFSPKDETSGTAEASALYVPGVYTSSIMLNGAAVDVAVTVSENEIESIQLVNISEAMETMYPLMEPALEDLAEQICSTQSLENLTYSSENQYTSQVLLDAVSRALDKAAAEESTQNAAETETE